MSFLLFALAFIVLVVCVPALFVPSKFSKVMTEFLKNASLVRVVSLWTLLVAFFFLAAYPLFTGGWLMVISILGRLMLIKSVVGLWFPVWLYKKFAYMCASKTGIMVMGACSLVFSIVLVWIGLVKL